MVRLTIKLLVLVLTLTSCGQVLTDMVTTSASLDANNALQDAQRKNGSLAKDGKSIDKKREQLKKEGKCPTCKGMGRTADGQYTCTTCHGTGKYIEPDKEQNK